jgi:hypothetical protein
MKHTAKHGLIAVVCLAAAMVLVLFAIYVGAGLIEQSEAPDRILAARLLADAGKGDAADNQRRDISKQRKTALIICVFGVAGGAGLFRGVEELSRVLRPGICTRACALD